MVRLLSALALFGPLAAHAQSGAPEAPIETAGPYAIAVFLLVFFGAIAVYGWLTWRDHKQLTGDRHTGSKPVERT